MKKIEKFLFDSWLKRLYIVIKVFLFQDSTQYYLHHKKNSKAWYKFRLFMSYSYGRIESYCNYRDFSPIRSKCIQRFNLIDLLLLRKNGMLQKNKFNISNNICSHYWSFVGIAHLL